jgi:hypothetical protein
MSALRVRFLLVLIWTFFLGGLQSWAGLIPLSPVTGTFALALLIALFFAPRAVLTAQPWTSIAAVSLLLLIKHFFGYGIFGASLPQTALDVAAILITIVLAVKAGLGINTFSEAIARVGLGIRLRQFRQVQWQLFKEVQRARHSSQPLTLLSMSAQPQRPESQLDRFTEEAVRATARKYALGQVAGYLQEEMRVCDTIAQRGDHLIAIVPSTKPEEANEMLRQFQKDVRSKLNLDLVIGKASFPHEELTLFGLMERAEAERKSRIKDLSRPPKAVLTGVISKQPNGRKESESWREGSQS